jgi:hypothetical protein
VKQVFITRVTPLLLYLAPAVVTVGSLLVYTNFGNGLVLLRISVALFGAMQIAAITMGGSMYFASRYAQSSNTDLLSPQGQDMSNLKRTIFQTIVNLLLVGPIMLLVLSASWVGKGFIIDAGVGISLASIVYSVVILNVILNKAGDTIVKREDL